MAARDIVRCELDELDEAMQSRNVTRYFPGTHRRDGYVLHSNDEVHRAESRGQRQGT